MEDLLPGDIVVIENRRHVLIFDSWFNETTLEANLWESLGYPDDIVRLHVYDLDDHDKYTFGARRFNDDEQTGIFNSV